MEGATPGDATLDPVHGREDDGNGGPKAKTMKRNLCSRGIQHTKSRDQKSHLGAKPIFTTKDPRQRPIIFSRNQGIFPETL